jgi:ABC-type transport system involved in multi-copper enzyme maturation permease subunit
MKGLLWLSWRQQRAAIVTAISLLAVCALLSLDAVAKLLELTHVSTTDRCMEWGWCQSFREYRDPRIDLWALGYLLSALPTLIGIFWGAPLLSRDVERGTDRLVLTQDANRTRWFTYRFTLAAACTVLLSTGMSLSFGWWWVSYRDWENWFGDGLRWSATPIMRGTGPSLVAAALFGLATGTAAGLLLRRMVPAMLTTLGVVAGLGIFLNDRWKSVAPTSYVTDKSLNAGHHFWTVQWLESAIYLGLTAAVVALTYWLLHRSHSEPRILGGQLDRDTRDGLHHRGADRRRGDPMKGLLWLSWRQQRATILAAIALLAICALVSANGRSTLLDIVRTGTDIPCLKWDGCNGYSVFKQTHFLVPLEMLGYLNVALPTLIGIFWGAPLFSWYVERGTDRLVLTQDANRTRWFTSRFALAAACTVLLSTGTSLLFAWWWGSTRYWRNGYGGILDWSDQPVFDGTGPRVIPAALFGLAVGTAFGLLLRSVVPAMFATFGVVAGLGFLLEAVRLKLVTPTYVSDHAVSRGEYFPRGFSEGFLTSSGRHVDAGACPWDDYLEPDEFKACMDEHGYVSTLHEAPHDFWTFQWVESAILLGLTAAVIALTYRLVRRRRI